MKTIVVIGAMCLIFNAIHPIQAQNESKKNIAGFGSTYVPYLKHGMYFDDPFDFFPNQEPSVFIRLFYARKLNETLRLGSYLEAAAMNEFTDQSGDSPHSFSKQTIGIDWVSRYPETKLHLELGGYFGYSFLKANNWANLKGIDFGMLAGPAYETKHFGVSVMIKAGFAPYFSSGTPEGILLYAPGMLFQVYGKF